MIMTKILEEQQKNPLKQVENCFIRSRINFKTAGMTIRKIYHQDTQEPQSSNDQKISISPQNIQKTISLRNPELLQQNCSKFMKTYIDKLKRQRKREKKKISSSSPKETNMACNITAFPTLQHGQQKLLLLQKLNPLTYRSNHIHATPSARTFNSDYLYQIIKEIKEQRGISQNKNAMKKRLSQGLPALEHKQSKSNQQFYGEPLDPWQAEVQHQESPFDTYK